jgi:TP901 family phage tail tape measure protein
MTTENLKRLLIDLKDVEALAKKAEFSVDDLDKALKSMSDTGNQLKAIKVYGLTDENVSQISKALPEIGKAYIQTVADLTQAHEGQGTQLKKVIATYDAYTQQLKITGEAQEQLRIKLGEAGKKEYTLPVAIPVSATTNLADVDKLNAVQQEMIDKLGGGTRAIDQAKAMSEKYGMSLDNLNRAYTDAVNGVTRFTWRIDHGNGVVREASVYIDQFGNALGDTSTRFRSTAAMIERNIGKVFEWAVAVGAVYGTIRRIGQALDDMKELQMAFADIAIVTNTTTDAAMQYSDALFQVAEATGVTFKDIVGIYDDVLRATANVADETERYAKANSLLTSSAMMARLANISAAQGYDMMLGALRQSGLELDQGIILLDKWQAVAKAAGVSVEDLAQGFAITADIAKAAGVDIDKLNGLLATLQESTTLSSTEVGNAIRAMMSTYTTERSISVLNQYGISVQDLAGDYRSLWSVLQQVAAMYETGVMSESQLKAVADALGGGQRRAAQVVTVITHLTKAQESAAVSANAHGDAERALAVKMDTLQTATNNLTTAWQKFATVLGTKGGVLDMLTGMTNGMTNAVGGITDLIAKIGPLTSSLVQLAAVIGAFSYFKSSSIFAGLGAAIGKIQIPGAPINYTGTMASQESALREGYKILEYQTKAGIQQQRYQNIATGQFASPAEALMWQTTMKPYQGTIPGSAAYAPLTSAVGWLKNPANLAGVFSTAAIAAAPLLTQGITDESVTESAGGAIGAAFGWAITQSPIGGMIGATIGEAVLGTLIKGAKDMQETMTAPLETLTDEQLARRRAELVSELAGGTPWGTAPDIRGLNRDNTEDVKKNAREQIDAIDAVMAARKKSTETEVDVEANLYEQLMAKVADIDKANAARLPTVHQIKIQALEDFASGKLTRKQFNDLVQAAENATTTIGQFWYHMADQMGADVEDVFSTFLGASAETMNMIMADVAELNALTVERESVWQKLNGDEYISLVQAVALNKEYVEAGKNIEDIKKELELLYSAAKREAAPPVPEFGRYEMSTEQLEKYIAQAQQIMLSFAEATGIEIQQLWEDAAYYAFTDEGTWYKINQNVNQKALQMAIQMGQTVSSNFNLERLTELGPEQWPQIVQRTRYWEELFRRIGKPVEQEPITFLLGEKNDVRTLTASMDAVRYALDDLRQVEEKQMLEGMWNIPAGATFYVPLSSLFYQQTQGQGGGTPELPPYGSGAGMAGAGISVLGTTSSTTAGKLNELASASDNVRDMFLQIHKVDVGPHGGAKDFADTATEVTNKMMADTAKMLAETDWSTIWQPGRSLQELTTSEIKVEIPTIEARFEIENNINIDGTFLRQYVSEVLAEDVARAAKAGKHPATVGNTPIMRHW